MAIVALHPWVKVCPSPFNGAFKKRFRAFIYFAISSPRTPHETHIQFTRTTSVIYHTEMLHRVSHITPPKQTDLTFTYAITREELPEASPNGPALEHFDALAGQRNRRTLGIHGLAARPLSL